MSKTRYLADMFKEKYKNSRQRIVFLPLSAIGSESLGRLAEKEHYARSRKMLKQRNEQRMLLLSKGLAS